MSNVVALHGAVTPDSAWPEQLQRNQHGAPLATLANAIAVMMYHPQLVGAVGFDTYKQVKTKRKKLPFPCELGAWRDTDSIELRAWFSKNQAMNLSAEVMNSAVEAVSRRNTYDSLKEQIDGYKWDGVFRLENVAEVYFGAGSDKLSNLFCKRFLIQAIARALDPGCKADCMLVFEGAQGKRKSTALQTLFGGRVNYSENRISFSDKDGMQSIASIWCQEIAELDALKRSEVTEIKAFLSKREDRYRPAYGREVIEIPRRCVFTGTTNDDVWNDDTTGGRRFWPVKICNDIRLDLIERDRELLWAEARERYRSGEKYWFDEDELDAADAREAQAARTNEHPWAEIIESYASNLSAFDRDSGLSAVEILTNAIGIEREKITKRDTMHLPAIMRSIGWVRDKQQSVRKGARVRLYRPETIQAPPLTPQPEDDY